jgi:hypothetical protein
MKIECRTVEVEVEKWRPGAGRRAAHHISTSYFVGSQKVDAPMCSTPSEGCPCSLVAPFVHRILSADSLQLKK